MAYLGGHPDLPNKRSGLTLILDGSGIWVRRRVRRLLTLPWRSLRGLEIRMPNFWTFDVSAVLWEAARSGSYMDVAVDGGVCGLYVQGVGPAELRAMLASWVVQEAGPPKPVPAEPPPAVRGHGHPLEVVEHAWGILRAEGLGRERLYDRSTLAYRLSVAKDHRVSGRPLEAIALLGSLAAEAASAFGTNDGDTLKVRNELGLAYLAAGQADDAIDLLGDILAAAMRLHGPDDYETLSIRNNLAVSYQHVGQYARAIDLHEQNVVTTERLHGRDHIETIGRRNNLAATVALAGYRQRAIELYWEVLDSMDTISRHHDLAVNARQNLAILHNPAWGP
ncbi:tetratricopeptide repeat protein [Streptosporangium canum]|uniref:tetratricopeptide repeat protein n=1 Tax=Streptosporangium canum TaxID=324952 RepID=UPI0034236331